MNQPPYGQPPGGQGYPPAPGYPQQPAPGYAQPQPPPGYPHHQPGQGPPPPGVGMQAQQYTAGGAYEFDAQQNAILSRAGGRTRLFGLLLLISGALNLLSANLIGAGINFAVGASFHGGGGALKRVVETQGNDLTHLMEAVDKLKTAFTIRLVLVIIAAVLVLLVMLVVFLTLAAGTASVLQGLESS